DPDPRTQAEHARLAAKYIFPRQYGLPNPFQVTKKFNIYRDNIDRQAEIEVWLFPACKTPKRIKNVLSILGQMIWKHSKCGYKPHLDFACPSKVIKQSTLKQRSHTDF
ncbi:hypothetical protein M378DRAFT_86032, partial [Amanita muscaria Koide BX008]